jgi:hypothetical protein
MERSPRIVVYGSSTVGEADADYALARELGRALARAGATVVTGGYGGIMEAASRGAAEASGHVVGVTVDLYSGRGSGNRWVAERRNAPDLHERLRTLTSEAQGFVAVTGSLGTLAEVTLTWTLLAAGARPPAPLVLLGRGWRAWLEGLEASRFVAPAQVGHVRLAASAEEAARLALAGVSAGRPVARGGAVGEVATGP